MAFNPNWGRVVGYLLSSGRIGRPEGFSRSSSCWFFAHKGQGQGDGGGGRGGGNDCEGGGCSCKDDLMSWTAVRKKASYRRGSQLQSFHRIFLMTISFVAEPKI